MLRSINRLIGYRLTAIDGSIGSVDDILFDDRTWIIRYVVANTGGWLSGRQVLLSPHSFGSPDWQAKAIPVSLTKDQIENSPDTDADKPVSRQHEAELHDYYGWPPYWSSYLIGGMGWIQLPLPAEGEEEHEKRGDPNLCSIGALSTYSVQAEDGDSGHIKDFVFDDEAWAIRYIVVDTRHWLPGRRVLISPEWISSVRWDEKKVCLDMSRESIKNGPEYDPSEPVNHKYEEVLYDYYGRPRHRHS